MFTSIHASLNNKFFISISSFLSCKTLKVDDSPSSQLEIELQSLMSTSSSFSLWLNFNFIFLNLLLEISSFKFPSSISVALLVMHRNKLICERKVFICNSARGGKMFFLDVWRVFKAILVYLEFKISKFSKFCTDHNLAAFCRPLSQQLFVDQVKFFLNIFFYLIFNLET